MENFTITKDINVLCVTAESFPDGIVAAYDKLDTIVPISPDRRQFGISRRDGAGNIIYKAASEEKTTGEAEKFGLERFVIKSGQFISVTVKDFMQNIPEIAKSFQELLRHPDIDPNGYCLEWILSERDVRCMVRLKS